MIIDPDNDNQAIDERDGLLSFAFRMFPNHTAERPPTPEEFDRGVIIGYGRINPDEGMHF